MSLASMVCSPFYRLGDTLSCCSSSCCGGDYTDCKTHIVAGSLNERNRFYDAPIRDTFGRHIFVNYFCCYKINVKYLTNRYYITNSQIERLEQNLGEKKDLEIRKAQTLHPYWRFTLINGRLKKVIRGFQTPKSLVKRKQLKGIERSRDVINKFISVLQDILSRRLSKENKKDPLPSIYSLEKTQKYKLCGQLFEETLTTMIEKYKSSENFDRDYIRGALHAFFYDLISASLLQEIESCDSSSVQNSLVAAKLFLLNALLLNLGRADLSKKIELSNRSPYASYLLGYFVIGPALENVRFMHELELRLWKQAFFEITKLVENRPIDWHRDEGVILKAQSDLKNYLYEFEALVRDSFKGKEN